MNELLSKLNKEQREAVECINGPLLVLAGAGSGKTRVPTTRIAYMIGEKGIAPWNILAITFTNKAANEIKERLVTALGDEDAAKDIWAGTFHSICMRILRVNCEKIGYKIREAQLQKVPYMLVVGEKEIEAGAVGVRSRKDGDIGAQKLEEFISKIKEEIENYVR